MAADRARVSHDPSREYRAIVPQQGRVTLEADGNEASRIAEDALRADIVDIVGPFGTPDDGYEVSASGNTVTIGAGSYYLGGWRVQLAQSTILGKFPDEVDLGAPQLPSGNYAIALLLTEQEVSAVEDRALLEVALGGPDTCQRTRLMQRAVAIRVGGDDCSSAEGDLDKALLSQGAMHDHKTGMLKPAARLQVQVISPPVPADPCDPPASGGYLGADNQLIRVAVASYNPQTGQGRLVWGFDNSSTLYRASTTDGQVLTLESMPIDNDHAPRMGQAVEVLRTRRLFDHGDVIAADSGLVTKVAQPYNSDLRTVQLAATLSAGSRGDAQHPLFLRLWQEEIPFSKGVAVALGDTGFAVTLSLNAAPGPIVARPFWTFAVRPSTPVIIYPRRYLDAPQPPEGPRQWLAPLAVAKLGGYVVVPLEVAGPGGQGAASRAVARPRGQTARVLDDCRDTFLPLTKLRPGCCGVMLDADMHGRRDFIQRALDRLRGTRGTVTLRPGHYRLRKPIRMDSSHKGLTLEGCGEGVFLEAADEDDPAFSQGLIVLDDVNEVTLRSLQLQMPITAFKPECLRVLALLGAQTKAGAGSIGISATGCAQLTIAECQLRFRMRDKVHLFAVGFLARGECWGLRMTHNRFLHDIDYGQDVEPVRFLCGYGLAPAIAITNQQPTLKQLSDARLDALLDDAEISDNRFVGLTYATLVSARLGFIRIERNRVQGCSAGLYILESALGTALRTVRQNPGVEDRAELVPTHALAALMTFAACVPATSVRQPALDRGLLRAAAREADLRARTFAREGDANDFAREGSANDTAGVPPAPAVPPNPPPIIVTGTRGVSLASIFERIAAAIDVRIDRLVAGLHVHANDVQTFGTLSRKPPRGRAGTDEPEDPVLGAIHIVLELRERDSGDVLVTGNRFGGLRNPVARFAWPYRLVFGSNMVIGASDSVDKRGFQGGGALAIVMTGRQAMLEVMGNVVEREVSILPTQRPNPPSQDWAFVNWTS